MSDPFVKLCAVSDIEENASKAFTIEGQNILVCHAKGEFYAVNNICTHQFQELEGGKIRSHYIFCPLHGQRFNLKDGAPIGQLTDKPLTTYELHIDGDNVLVNPHPTDGAPD